MSQSDDLKKLINTYSRRLQKLKERQAVQGLDSDPAVLIQIEDIETELDQLKKELATLESNTLEGYGRLATPTTASPKPSLRQTKIKSLERRMTDLMAKYEAANTQLSNTLSEVDRLRLKRQVETLEKEIGEVVAKLNSMRRK